MRTLQFLLTFCKAFPLGYAYRWNAIVSYFRSRAQFVHASRHFSIGMKTDFKVHTVLVRHMRYNRD